MQNKDKPEEGLQQMQILIEHSLPVFCAEDRVEGLKKLRSPELDNVAYKLVALIFSGKPWGVDAGQVPVQPQFPPHKSLCH